MMQLLSTVKHKKLIFISFYRQRIAVQTLNFRAQCTCPTTPVNLRRERPCQVPFRPIRIERNNVSNAMYCTVQVRDCMAKRGRSAREWLFSLRACCRDARMRSRKADRPPNRQSSLAPKFTQQKGEKPCTRALVQLRTQRAAAVFIASP